MKVKADLTKLESKSVMKTYFHKQNDEIYKLRQKLDEVFMDMRATQIQH